MNRAIISYFPNKKEIHILFLGSMFESIISNVDRLRYDNEYMVAWRDNEIILQISIKQSTLIY